MEYWKTCKDHDEDYMVSNMGNVISFKRSKQGRLLKPYKAWKKNRKIGYYLEVGFSKNNIRYTITVHKLVMHYFFGPRPNGLQIDHINRNKHDNRISNLKYVTQSENMINRDDYRLDISEKNPKLRKYIQDKESKSKNQKICICGCKYPYNKKRWIRHLQTKRHKNAIKNFFKF